MVSEASLSCTYDFALGKKKVLNHFHAVDVITPCLFHTQFNIIHIHPLKSLSFCFPSKKCIQVSYLFRTFKFPCLSYHFCLAFGRSRVSNLGSHTGYPDSFSCFYSALPIKFKTRTLWHATPISLHEHSTIQLSSPYVFKTTLSIIIT